MSKYPRTSRGLGTTLPAQSATPGQPQHMLLLLGQPPPPTGLLSVSSPRSGGRRTFLPGAGCSIRVAKFGNSSLAYIYPDHLSRPSSRESPSHLPSSPPAGRGRSVWLTTTSTTRTSASLRNYSPERSATRARLSTDEGDLRSNQPVPRRRPAAAHTRGAGPAVTITAGRHADREHGGDSSRSASRKRAEPWLPALAARFLN